MVVADRQSKLKTTAYHKEAQTASVVDKKETLSVCMISPTLPDIKCGVGDYAACLLELLQPKTVEVSVITSADNRINRAFLDSDQVNPIKIFGIVNHWGYSSLPLILRKISLLKPSLVHIQYETHMYSEKSMINFLPLFGKALRLPCSYIITMHEFEGPHLFSGKGIFGGMGPRSLMRFMLAGGLLKDIKLRSFVKWGDSIIVTNEEHLHHLENEFPSKKSKFKCIVLGPSLQSAPSNDFNRPAFRREKGLNDSDILLSYFGFLRPDKKVDLLLHAIKELINKGYKTKLLVVASAGDVVDGETAYYQKLRALVKELGIEEHIIWTGYLSSREASDYLSCSDICVLPFESGVSEKRTSFVTAVSLGLPVITTKRNTVPPDFRDHFNVLLVSPNDLGQLVEAIIELANSESLRKEVGIQAKELSKNFSWEQIANKTIMVYQEKVTAN